MELVILFLFFLAGVLIWKLPRLENVAFLLVVIALVAAMAIFLIGNNAMLLPGINY